MLVRVPRFRHARGNRGRGYHSALREGCSSWRHRHRHRSTRRRRDNDSIIITIHRVEDAECLPGGGDSIDAGSRQGLSDAVLQQQAVESRVHDEGIHAGLNEGRWWYNGILSIIFVQKFLLASSCNSKVLHTSHSHVIPSFPKRFRDLFLVLKLSNFYQKAS